MVCKNCGNEIMDGMNFCTSCGTKVEDTPDFSQQQAYNQPNYNQPDYGQPDYNQQNYQQPYGYQGMNNRGNIVQTLPVDKKKLIGIGGALVAVIVAIIIVCSSCGGGGMNRPLKSMEKAFKNGDISALLDAVLPSQAHSTFYTVEEISEDDMGGMFGGISEFIDKISIDIKDEGRVVTGSDAEQYESALSRYGVANVQEIRTDVQIEMSVTVSMMGQSETQSMTESATFYKYGGKWYIHPGDAEDMF